MVSPDLKRDKFLICETKQYILHINSNKQYISSRAKSLVNPAKGGEETILDIPGWGKIKKKIRKD